MSCAYSKELLALYVEGDLAAEQSNQAQRHVALCPECQQSCEQLQQSQTLFKSLRQDSVSSSALAEVRQAVLARTERAEETLGWAVRLERLALMGFRRPRYAIAGLTILAIVSVSLLMGQLRQSASATENAAAVFEGSHTLLRPEGYREWVFVGSSTGLSYSPNPGSGSAGMPPMFHNVYISPTAYREYARTGEFPEGTVMVLEMAGAEAKQEPGLEGSYEKDFLALEASVKDSSRFEGGWAYFSFTGPDGKLKEKAEPFSEEAGCRKCHQERAAKDHVFTQFYPVLRSVGAIMTP